MSRAEPSTSAPEERQDWLVLSAAATATFLVMVDTTIVAIAMPTIASDLDIDIGGVQWIVAAYLLSFASLVVVGGSAADRWGPKRVFIGGVAWFAVGSALCAFSPGAAVLLLGRVVTGACAGFMLPAALATLSRTYRGPQRGIALGVWSGVSGAALSVGPVLGALLLTSFGWRSVFWIAIPFAAAAIILGQVTFPPDAHPDGVRARGLDYLGACLIAIASAAMIEACVSVSTERPAISTAGALLIAIVAFVGFLIRQRRAKEPLIQLGLFRDRSFTAAIVGSAGTYFGLMGALLFLAYYLQRGIGASVIASGFAMLPLMVVYMLLAPVGGRLAGQYGSRQVITFGLVIGAIGMLAVAFAIWHSGSIAALVPGLVLMGVGLGFTIAPIAVALLASAPVSSSGVAAGMNTSIREIAGALGVSVFSVIVMSVSRTSQASQDWNHGVAVAMAAGGTVLALASVVVSALMRPPDKQIRVRADR